MAKHKLMVPLAAAGFLLIAALFLSLSIRVRKLESALAELGLPTEELVPAGDEPAGDKPESAETEPLAAIATAIRFETQSSPLLTPQTTLIVTIPRVAKYKDRIILDVIADAGGAASYSAFVPEDKFILVEPDGTEVYAIDAEGGFASIPPESSIAGKLTFELVGDAQKIILKIETASGAEYYEFNFQTRTYREARLG